MKKQVEMSIQDENGNEFVAYPKTYKDHVQFDNGMTIDEYLEQDVAMPTVTHEESSIKVGVGDSDVSNSIVDGTIGKMVIKGQTYQNILPEPSLRNKMIGKSMQRLNEGYDNIEVVDGVSKSAILSGQTLNYLLPYKSFSCNKPQGYETEESNIVRTVYDNHVHYSLTLHSGRGTTISFNHTPNKQTTIYAGKTYTLYIPNYTHQNVKNKRLLMRDNNHAYNYTPIKQNSEYFVFTAIEDFDFLGLYQYFYFDSSYLGKTVECNVSQHAVIVEGDYFNQPLPLLEQGLNSCKMPVLKATGKNLFYSTFNYGFISDANGIINTNAKDWLSSDYVKLNKGTYTTSSYEPFNGAKKIAIYDDNKTFIKTTMPTTFTLEGDGYIRVGIKLTSSGNILENQIPLAKIQIEKGTTATSYEPFKSNILHTPEEVVLRSLPNGVKDTLNLNTGEYVERIGEVVLNGSESWALNTTLTNANGYYTFQHLPLNSLTGTNRLEEGIVCDKFPRTYDVNLVNAMNKEYCCYHGWSRGICICINGDKLSTRDVNGFKQWLSNNPTTVQYQLATPTIKTVDLSILDQNGGTQENLHSFANGHLQVSSEAENSLLPSVQYEIPTKNSYHMDLMKTNTLYTMKAKSVSGTFTIDGTSYNVNANGTFTSPSSMTDKLLVMSSKTNEEVMILEGDLTSKTIPYFKGIKSAFEDEDKIEVLSTGKNMINLNNIVQGNYTDALGWENRVTNDGVISKRLIQDGGRFACAIKVYVKPSTTYTLSFEQYKNGILTDQTPTYIYHNSGLWGNVLAQTNNTSFTFATKPETEYIVISVNYGSNTPIGEIWEAKNIQLQENVTVTEYEPYKSNTTKIPLLSPLRSLPNGVCDELIIDRLNHKAKLIQRIAKLDLKGEATERWVLKENHGNSGLLIYATPMPEDMKHYGLNAITGFISNNFYPGLWQHRSMFTGYLHSRTICPSLDSKIVSEDIAPWLSKNPTTVLYELETPIITEIDLEGYPYAYKDGHIFFNSDIAPTTQITYSINQAQQIESANENLQRHEKEISHLQKLIAQYIQVEYESTLLSLKI